MSAPLDPMAGSLALDAQSLAQLRNQANQSPDKALKAAAQQFESVFLNMMLKSMREATPQNGMFDNEQTKMFTGMLDQQLAQNISSKGIGLADIMVKQLSHGKVGQAANGKVEDKEGKPGVESGKWKAESGKPVVQPSSVTVPFHATAVPSAYSPKFQQDFMDRMLPYALQASQATGVPPQLMLGQAALESGWGKREIRAADGSNSFNLFGIKAGANWHGKVVDVTTTEYQNGVPTKQVASFRAYASYAEAFKDYAHQLSSNPRYAPVLQQGGKVAGMAQAIQQAGYATDPHYADKLSRVMAQLNMAGQQNSG